MIEIFNTDTVTDTVIDLQDATTILYCTVLYNLSEFAARNSKPGPLTHPHSQTASHCKSHLSLY